MFYHFLFPLNDLFVVFNVFRYITFRCVGAIVTAFLLVVLLTPWFIRRLRQYKIGQVIRDDGPKSHLSKEGVPTMGGAMIVGVLLAVALWFAGIGSYDDFRKIKKNNSKGLSARWKLFLQIIGGSIAALCIYQISDLGGQLSLPFFKNFRPDLGGGYVLFALLVIVAASNAVNLTDGLDGLATGPIVTTSAVYLVFSYLAGHVLLSEYLQIPFVTGAGEVAIFCGAMAGASLGFLWFNTFPAQIFMGDTGSLSLGASIGAVAIIIKQEILLVLVGGIFVMEALSVIMQVGFFKVSGGKRIFLMAPFHHHYEKKGWYEPKIVVRFWIVSIILGLSALATLKLR
jgi:phospho-N-acetylmuramoyl-pentapeptide-transferase